MEPIYIQETRFVRMDLRQGRVRRKDEERERSVGGGRSASHKARKEVY